MAQNRRRRLRTYFVMPWVLCVLVLVEELLTYQVRTRVADPYWRVLAILACYGLGFAFVSERLDPWLRRLYRRGQSTGRQAGWLGATLFFGAAYGGLYALFFILETRGVAALVP